METTISFIFYSFLSFLLMSAGFLWLTHRFIRTCMTNLKKRNVVPLLHNEKTEFIESVLEILHYQESCGITYTHTLATKEAKEKIKHLFDKNVRGQAFCPAALSSSDPLFTPFSASGSSKSTHTVTCKKVHACEEGHWLEERFCVQRNAHKSADCFGYEIKKASDKITFGDWSADEYIFRSGVVLLQHNTHVPIDALDRNMFMCLFGTYHTEKKRFSWSGSSCPKMNEMNSYGQMMVMDPQENIYIIYSPHFDIFGADKPSWVWLREVTVLAFWSRAKIHQHVCQKFNQRGFIFYFM